MSFISYAQNFEDVMLWRALKSIKNGFYIDIGAQDPVVDSVSLAFYENGWRGVHVEPTAQYSSKLRQARPDEIVEQVAIGDGEGVLTFYEFPDTGLSTADPVNAQNHKNAGFSCVETVVPILSLDALFQRLGSQSVHWMKIDVEGLEKSVLESWKESSVRPWVLLVESTRPMTQEENYSEWEELVLIKGYSFAYFDGLNRFYVHSTHLPLLDAFNIPPNIFDGFQLSGLASQPFCKRVETLTQQAEVKAQQAEVKAQQAEVKAQQAEVKAQQAEVKAHQAEVKAHQAEVKAHQAEVKTQQAEVRAQQANLTAQLAEDSLHAICNSHSWRMTLPLRLMGKVARWLLHGSIAWLTFSPMSRPRRVLKGWLISLKNKINAHPGLKAFTLRFLSRFPMLKARLKNIGKSQGATSIPSCIESPEQLSPRARQIYSDLKTAIEQNQKGNC